MEDTNEVLGAEAHLDELDIEAQIAALEEVRTEYCHDKSISMTDDIIQLVLSSRAARTLARWALLPR